MIFLSHTHADKPVVDVVAQRLAAVFGQEKVFYDSWSIQPGDGIIDKMNAGLTECRFFFLFVSKRSLQSGMVKLEWQNALLKSTKGDTKIIPVRLDDVLLPAVLLQTLYIDLFTQGFETGVRQMIDVTSGRSTYRPSGSSSLQNVRAYMSRSAEAITIEFRAEVYMEPQSRYLILLANTESEVSWSAVGEGQYESGFNSNISLNNGRIVNGLLMARQSATSPGFPFIAEVKSKTGAEIKILGTMRIAARDQFAGIPLIEQGPHNIALQPTRAAEGDGI